MPRKAAIPLPKLQVEDILVDEHGWIYPSRKWREDDAEFALGLTYDPNAPDETIANTDFINAPVRFTMMVEDVMQQNLTANPKITLVVPMGVNKFPNSYLTVTSLSRMERGQRIRVEMDWHSAYRQYFSSFTIVRMNPKARLHIIVNC